MPKRKLPANETVIAMYRSGMSGGEIAEECNVAPVTVVSLLKRIGEPRRDTQLAAVLRTERGRSCIVRFWTGKRQSKEHVERRISKIRGKQHYLWKDGASRRAYRGLIPKDRCARCAATEQLGIHHKDLDHYNDQPGNLEVLCTSCHMSLHKTMYWEAMRKGIATPKGNGPVGWIR